MTREQLYYGPWQIAPAKSSSYGESSSYVAAEPIYQKMFEHAEFGGTKMCSIAERCNQQIYEKPDRLQGWRGYVRWWHLHLRI